MLPKSMKCKHTCLKNAKNGVLGQAPFTLSLHMSFEIILANEFLFNYSKIIKLKSLTFEKM
jgi:hypothetical protein